LVQAYPLQVFEFVALLGGIFLLLAGEKALEVVEWVYTAEIARVDVIPGFGRPDVQRLALAYTSCLLQSDKLRRLATLPPSGLDRRGRRTTLEDFGCAPKQLLESPILSGHAAGTQFALSRHNLTPCCYQPGICEKMPCRLDLT
jgi:hypothetical protein